MILQEITIIYLIKRIFIFTIIIFILYFFILKLIYKNNLCKLSYIWERLKYKNILNEIIKIKNKLQNK
jgi:hypothetical protein